LSSRSGTSNKIRIDDKIGLEEADLASMSETASASANSNKQLIDMLRRSRLFRDYETVFTKATGLPLALRPLEYWQLAHRGKKHENAFCALLAERPATLAVCLQAHQEMIDHTGLIPHSVTCPFGLTETAVPVRLGAEIIGYLRIGQILRHVPANSDRAKVTRAARREIHGRNPQRLGEKPARSARPLQCNCAAACIFC
jgi:hypothetical protein